MSNGVLLNQKQPGCHQNENKPGESFQRMPFQRIPFQNGERSSHQQVASPSPGKWVDELQGDQEGGDKGERLQVIVFRSPNRETGTSPPSIITPALNPPIPLKSADFESFAKMTKNGASIAAHGSLNGGSRPMTNPAKPGTDFFRAARTAAKRRINSICP